MKSISVITINYNNRSGLEKTFASVFSQTKKDFEYIVIDGGSSDGSEDLIENHLSEINYFVSEKDNGIYHAMNKGIRASTGDFVIFMNSGDLFSDNSQIETICNELKNDDEIVYGDVRLLNKITNYDAIQKHPKVLSFKYFYNQTICHQACIIKRSLFEFIFYYNEAYKIASDWEFLIVAIFINNVKYRKIASTIAIFDCGGISTNGHLKLVAKQEREQVLNKYFSLFKDDYAVLASHSSVRSQNLLLIQKSKFFRGIVSAVFFMILKFLPKK